jgi:mono/diheme cytochrome c family protein
MHQRHRSLLGENCQGCHGPEKQKGNFRVDDLPLTITDVASAERWQKVLSAMNSGEMPPDDERQPDAKAKTDFLDDLASTLVTARRQLSDQHGVITLRRLNRREYQNTIRVLLGVNLDVSELPSDTGGPHFDTVGANLFLNGNQFEQYESLAREALEQAFTAKLAGPSTRKHRVESETLHRVFLKRNKDGLDAMERANNWIKAVDNAVAQPGNASLVADLRQIAPSADALRYHWKKIPGAPSPMEFGFDKTAEVNPAGVYLYRDFTEFVRYDQYYLSLPHLDQGAYLTEQTRVGGGNNIAAIQGLPIPPNFPPGEYIVRIRAAATEDAPPERKFLEFGLKGSRGGSTPALSTHHITGTIEQPQIIEVPFSFRKGNADRGHRNLFIRERGAADGRHDERVRTAYKQNGFGPKVALWIDWIEIEHLSNPEDLPPPGIRALEIPLDDKTTDVPPNQLRTAFADFVREAYRGGNVPEGTLERLTGIYKSRVESGNNHRTAVIHTLASVLSSPQFLYRAEPDATGMHRSLSDLELATRLSYFLLGEPPDSILRELAARGDLRQTEVLSAQTDRLLNHARSGQFVRPFLSQWLLLDRLDLFQFSQKLYPQFDDSVKAAARQEVTETFAHLLRSNAPLSDLLRADYALVNALLARYYGIEGVDGDHFRKIALPPDSPRGGLLGMAAIMAMGSNGERTNPVERGAWVLRKLLNEPPPPAPANVPEIARLAGKRLTTRERLLAHQENPQCASCHRKIDPIGFGLENFDATGIWRTTDSYQPVSEGGEPDPLLKITWEIDSSSVFHKGPAFGGYFEMRDHIATKRRNFAKGFCSALIEYALGRPCGFSDEGLVESVVNHCEKKGFATREFLHALIQSKEFRSK